MKGLRRNLLVGIVIIGIAGVFGLFLTACPNNLVNKGEDPSVAWPLGLEGRYGDSLLDIPLSSYDTSLGSFSWTNPSAPLSSLGLNTFNMTFTPADTGKLNTVTFNVAVRVRLLEMKSIPGAANLLLDNSGETGRFPNETSRSVSITTFLMGKYEVTQQQYEFIMKTNPSHFTTAATGENRNMLPVESVTWYDAVLFCNYLSAAEGLGSVYTIVGNNVTPNWAASGYRLPTEAEWECACRGNTTTAFNNSSDAMDNDTGWYAANSVNRTHQVGKLMPNSYGLYDMHGNVWEWCWDLYGAYQGAATNPRGATDGINRVSRGGAWCYGERFLRSAYRGISTPDDAHQALGFRVVRQGN